MSKTTTKVNDNDQWDCEYLAIMILRQQDADEDNREVYRVQKCRMKKELNDMENDMKAKGLLKRKRIFNSIIEIAKEFEEPMKLRDENKQKYNEIRELKTLINTTEEYWTQKVREQLKHEYSKEKAESDLNKQLKSSREVNRRLIHSQSLLEERLQHIQDNCIVVPKDDHANFCQDHAEMTLKALHNKSPVKDKTIKQLRKKK